MASHPGDEKKNSDFDIIPDDKKSCIIFFMTFDKDKDSNRYEGVLTFTQCMNHICHLWSLMRSG